jgi:hypothetical protein
MQTNSIKIDNRALNEKEVVIKLNDRLEVQNRYST